jgi:hypothetical protein
MREALFSNTFINRHKTASGHFTRQAILSFSTLCILMLRKGTQSLQLSLNAFVPMLNMGKTTVTKMAYSKARHKLKHTAFIELNQEAVVRTMYADDDCTRYKGFRVFAIDGSVVQLPDTEEIREVFGTVAYDNKSSVPGKHPYALASVCYDVLNRIALDAQLLPCRTYEVTAARAHLDPDQWRPDTITPGLRIGSRDLVTYDRGYHAYLTMAATLSTGANFLIRCKRNSGMPGIDAMLRGEGPHEQLVTVTPPTTTNQTDALRAYPLSLRIRLVRVILKDGAIEVLATSVLDEAVLSRGDLAELYWLRWGIETFYGIVKTRLTLENFSGLSPDAVRQDFFSTILLCGIETIVTADAEEQLAKQTGGHPKKVNKAVSFSAIKRQVFDLLVSDLPDDELFEELTAAFISSPTLVRKDRNPPRNKQSSHQLLSWWRRKRKGVF